MPKKAKLKTVFKNEQELREFLAAIVTECSTLGQVIARTDPDKQEEVANKYSANVLTRIQIVMSDYHKMRVNGDMDDVMAGIPESDYAGIRKSGLEFTNKVIGEYLDVNGKEKDNKKS